ncbi:hypothetical protein DIPPA_03881 [Diplonema papillatum]|nr:hypothetical protein DIPPA_03881 [Diplonema papillatum]
MQRQGGRLLLSLLCIRFANAASGSSTDGWSAGEIAAAAAGASVGCALCVAAAAAVALLAARHRRQQEGHRAVANDPYAEERSRICSALRDLERAIDAASLAHSLHPDPVSSAKLVLEYALIQGMDPLPVLRATAAHLSRSSAAGEAEKSAVLTFLRNQADGVPLNVRFRSASDFIALHTPGDGGAAGHPPQPSSPAAPRSLGPPADPVVGAPEHFYCPVTGGVMRVPVKCGDGFHSFEKEALLTYFDSCGGQRRCPVSLVAMPEQLVEDEALAAEISAFFSKRPSPPAEEA